MRICVCLCVRMSQCIVRKLLFGDAIVHFNLQRKRISVIRGRISQYCKISLTHNEYNEAQIVKSARPQSQKPAGIN